MCVCPSYWYSLVHDNFCILICEGGVYSNTHVNYNTYIIYSNVHCKHTLWLLHYIMYMCSIRTAIGMYIICNRSCLWVHERAMDYEEINLHVSLFSLAWLVVLCIAWFVWQSPFGAVLIILVTVLSNYHSVWSGPVSSCIGSGIQS